MQLPENKPENMTTGQLEDEAVAILKRIEDFVEPEELEELHDELNAIHCELFSFVLELKERFE